MPLRVLCAAALVGLGGTGWYAVAQQLGPVRDLVFETTGEGGAVLSWRPPADAAVSGALIYEVQDRGSGTWRPVHQGPEIRLRVLQLRKGACSVRVRARAGTLTGPWSETDCTVSFDTPVPGPHQPCVANSVTACLLDGRFEVRVQEGTQGPGPFARTDRQGQRARFKLESGGSVVLWMHDRCTSRRAFALEYETHTEQALRIQIRDAVAGRSKSFVAPAGRDRPAHVLWADAFETCGA